MRLDLTERQLSILHPAYILVDRDARIMRHGPALHGATMPEAGQALDDWFQGPDRLSAGTLAVTAAESQPLRLQARHADLALIGVVIEVAEGFLLAMNLLPLAGKSETLRLSDFGPGDPTGTLQLVTRMQQGFLNEARDLADSLMQEQERSSELLEQVVRASGYVGHDLNNHLSIVALNAGLLTANGKADENVQRIARRIANAAVQGTIISRSLMALSRHGMDKSVRIEVDRVLTNQAEFLSTVCGQDKHLELHLNAPGAWIDVVRPGVVNSVVNLLVNAGDASPPGAVIRLATRLRQGPYPGRPDTSGTLVEIEVTDQGTGMADNVLEKAFDPFYSTKSRGSGLGLASVREFVQAMEGDVQINSTPGKGTTIVLTFISRTRGGQPDGSGGSELI